MSDIVALWEAVEPKAPSAEPIRSVPNEVTKSVKMFGGKMLNVLYTAMVAACIAAGALGFPLWSVLVLTVLALWLHFSTHDQALSFGIKENGLWFLVLMFLGTVVICAVPFFIGRLIGFAFE